jgi:prepilin-type N-terminal cleavage/methylation domain-containing protein
MRSPSARSRTGFTLLELVTVIVVLAVLAAIAIPVYALVTARSQRAAAQTSLEALSRQIRAANAFDATNAMVSESSVAEAAADMSQVFAASTGVFAAPRASLQRDVAASYDRQVVSYALGEATTAGMPGTVYPGLVTDRRTAAPWVGLAVLTSAGDCVGIRFDRAVTVPVTMPDADGTCTGGSALIGSAVEGSPAAGRPDAPDGSANPAPGQNNGSGQTPGTGGQAQAAPVLTASAGDRQIVVTWPAVPGATSYTLLRDGVTVYTGGLLTFSDTGLENGTGYTYTATASGTAGTSAPSAGVRVTAVTAPRTPDGVTSEAGNRAVRVSWPAVVSTAAAPVAGYRVYVDGVQQWQDTGTSALIDGLDNGGVYRFTVQAFGPGGVSAQSSAVEQTPVDVAGTPVLTAAAGDRTVVLTWPATDRARTYEVFRDGVSVYRGPALTFTDTGLINGVRVVYTATAAGAGGASLTSSPVEVAAVGAPQVPSGLTVTAGAGMLAVAWDTVAGSSAAPVTGYRVYVDGVQETIVAEGHVNLDRLTNGTVYTVTVAAYGPGGVSAQSPGRAGTPVAAPVAPSGLSASGSSRTVALSWGAVATSAAAPVTGYEVFQDGVSLGEQTGTTRTVTGLTNGVEYTFTVRTKGSGADSAAAPAVKITPAGAPTTPAGLSVIAGDGQLKVSWDAVTSTAAGPVSGYRVYVDGVQRATPSSAEGTVSGLVNGADHRITVSAYGPGGESAQSPAVTGRPVGAPPAPAGLAASPSKGQVVLSWNTVTSTAGAPVTGYEVLQDGVSLAQQTGTGRTVTGLGNGRSYTFTVKTLGPVAASAGASVTATLPAVAPSAPSAVSVLSQATSALVSVDAVDNGGSPITGYTVTAVSGSATITATGSSSPVLVEGLTARRTWSFTITATNAVGTSGPSAAVTGTTTQAGPAGNVVTYAGTGGSALVNGSAGSSQFGTPYGVAADVYGNVYVADTSWHSIRRITPDGTVSTYAGTGTSGNRNGPAGTAQFNNPYAVAADTAGNVFVADHNNNAVRKIDKSGLVTTLASGFNQPSGLAVDDDGSVLVADAGNRAIKRVTQGGVVTTVVTITSSLAATPEPRDVVVDSKGDLFIADRGLNQILRVHNGILSVFAGKGNASTDNGPAASATFNRPWGLAVDWDDNLYVSQPGSHVIRKVTPAGDVSTMAGNTLSGYRDGFGTATQFALPRDITIDPYGVLFVADSANNRVRRIY